MFEWINKQGVKSDEGWVFQRYHRFCYHYLEGEHKLEISVESGEVFLKKELKWESPFENDSISDIKKREVKSRIKEALAFMGTKYKLTEQ